MSDTPKRDITMRDKALATLVVPHTRSLHIDSWQCPAPTGKAQHRCHRAKKQGLLCDQHHALAQKRLSEFIAGRGATPPPDVMNELLTQLYTLWAIERQNHKIGDRA